MKRLVNWAITNSPGMNVLVCALMLVGALAALPNATGSLSRF